LLALSFILKKMNMFNIILLLAGGGGGANIMAPEIGLIFWTLLIFLLFWFMMAKFAFKPIGQALKNREDTIRNSLEAAERAKEEMAASQAENEKIIAEAREEKAKILMEAKETGDRYINEAKDKAKLDAKKIVDDATAEIQVQKASALSEVKNQVGLIAVEMAEQVLGKELKDRNDQESYVAELIKNLNQN